MSYTKKIVCLAASRKNNGTCVAGKDVGGQPPGAWIRPISNQPAGELFPSDIALEGGGSPQLLDVLSIRMRKYMPHQHQTENHLIDDQQYWIKEGTLPLSALHQLLDTPSQLWLNNSESYNGTNDRVSLEDVTTHGISSSLFLIKPNNLSISVSTEWGRKRKVRASFVYNNEHYRLMVTDPDVESQYLRGTPKPLGKDTLLCVSLGEPSPYDSFCYKLIAGVLSV